MNTENSAPSVLILLATYNGRKWCEEQIKSIFAQLDVTLYICVSDDFSKDSTRQFIAAYENPRITILDSVVRYGSACQNFFRLLRDANIADYDYIAFCDQDDIWNPEKLSYSISRMKEQRADAFSSNVTAFWPNGRKKVIRKNQPQRKWDFLFESAGPGCSFVLTRKLACDLAHFININSGKMKHVAFHDWLTYAFARSQGYRWWIDAQSTMMYRQHDFNELGANSGITASLSRLKKISDGWYRNQVILIGTLVGARDSLPIKRLQRFSIVDRIILLCNILSFRRSYRDRVALLFLFLLPQKK